MIQPFNRHFFGLGLPLLVIVRRDSRKITCRTLTEIGQPNPLAAPLTEQEVDRLINEHGQPYYTVMFAERPVPGELLRSDLAGKFFQDLGSTCLDLDGGLGLAEWSDRANWVWPLDEKGRPGAAFNRYIATFETKARTPRLLDSMQSNCALQVYVPFRSCDFDECSVSLCLNQKYGLVGNQELGIEVTYQDVLSGAQKPFPELQLSAHTVSLAPNAYGSVTVQLVDGDGDPITDANADLYIEHTGGYIPRKKIATQNGQAVVRFGALGMEPGEFFSVKIGFKHYSNVAEIAIAVV